MEDLICQPVVTSEEILGALSPDEGVELVETDIALRDESGHVAVDNESLFGEDCVSVPQAQETPACVISDVIEPAQDALNAEQETTIEVLEESNTLFDLPLLDIPSHDAENTTPNTPSNPESATPKATITSYDAMDAAMAKSIRNTTNNSKNIRRSNSACKGLSPRLIAPTRSSSAKLKTRPTATPTAATSAPLRRSNTIPHAPAFHSITSRPLPQSSDEKMLLQIQAEAAAEAKRREEYKKFYTSSIAVPSTATTTRSTKPLTIPETPKFKITQRLGEKQTAVPAPNSCSKPAASAAASGPTIPKPFHFATDARVATHAAPVTSNPTTAELVQQFMNKTRGPITTTNAPLTTTTPTSPTFATAKRVSVTSRPLPISREQKEAQEIEEMQKYHFKANPVNPRIYGRSNTTGGVIGIPKVAAKPVTTSTPFNLATEARASLHKPVPTTESVSTTFKALPLPATTATPIVTPAPAPKPLTEPVSPKLHGATRASSAPPRRQLPHHSTKSAAPAIPTSAPLTLTTPIEFTLQTSIRGQYHASKTTVTEETPTFHALPMPASSAPFTPKLDGGKLTEVHEFHLSHPKPKTTVANEDEEEFVFHAKPVPSTTYTPTTITKPEREPLQAQNINLSTEQRLAKRKEFDAKIAAKLAQEKAEREAQQALALAAEAEEIAKLRKLPVSEGGMKFTAAPILASDPYPVAAVTTKPLTEPVSPQLKTKQRTRIM